MATHVIKEGETFQPGSGGQKKKKIYHCYIDGLYKYQAEDLESAKEYYADTDS